MAPILVWFHAVAMILFLIAFLVDWIRSRAQTRKYLKYGIAMGTLLVGLEVLSLATAPSRSVSSPVFSLCACGMDFLRMVAFTTLGMYYCFTLGRPSFPMLLRGHAAAETPTGSSLPLAPEVVSCPGGVVDTTPNKLSPGPMMPETSPVAQTNIVSPAPPEVVPRDAILSVLVVSLIGVIYSVALFVMVSPRLSEGMRRAFGIDDTELAQTVTVQVVLFVLLVAFGEEIVFRLGVQNFLAKYLRLRASRYWIAIVSTTVVWTMGHAGALEPAWVKLVQIFPMGLMFGWLCQRYGVESSILAHMVFNLALVFPSSSLLT
jgi:membrane protease YdiL (CAAX protease family)